MRYVGSKKEYRAIMEIKEILDRFDEHAEKRILAWVNKLLIEGRKQ